MTAQEVASFVVARWVTLEHDATFIMIQLISAGHPARKADVLAIIRRYVDLQTENLTYKVRQ